MGAHVIDVSAHSTATSCEVFRLLADGSSWPTWGAWTAFTLESPGADAPEGPGAVRVFTSRAWGRTTVTRERVLEIVPDRRIGYQLLSGLPLRNYRAAVDLEPADGGTTIRWHATFDGATPGPAWLYRRALSGFIADAARRVAGYAQLHTATR
ncbi:MAG TPA: SRPBCC family protein [Kineosporiaceae bacterium]|jgi:Polyketide cyclase / dehydrase and lipid transport|nr:SRPBCC family protein [Kineosporiaceae bacterium]